VIRAGVVGLGLLTVLAQAGLLAVLALAALGRREAADGRIGPGLTGRLARVSLPLAWLVALVATGGSLFLSEIAHFPPCVLCWYQRVAMYPLAVLLGVAVWRRDPGIRPYGLALAGLGLPVSAYHYLLEWFPQLEGTACDPTNPCTLVWVRLFGYVSIPLMAGTAFAVIGTLLVLLGTAPGRSAEGGPSR
jgi:disulfide bond formation protein DsbB